MTDESDDVTSEMEFQRRLSALVSDATANDVGVEGGWTAEVRSADETWDVVISLLASDESADSGEFQTRLTDLIAEAHASGIDVRGGWEVEVESATSETLDIVITSVESDDAAE